MVERLGIPTASIIGSGFLKQAEVIKKGQGVPLAIGVYPGAPMVDSEEELKRKVEEEPAPGTVVMSGTYDEIQEHFHKQLWTDGLPVTPPTRERVDAFLKFTDRMES